MEIKEIKLLEYLNKCSIEFGIFDGEGNLAVQVNILNTDNTITQQEMKVRDVMYFTEYGTITLPGRRILQKSLLYINRLLNEELDKIVEEVFQGNLNEAGIESRLQEICLKIRDYVKNYMIATIQRTNQLGTILKKDQDDNKYLYDLEKLSKYIRCILKTTN